jgi:hypothetical protein
MAPRDVEKVKPLGAGGLNLAAAYWHLEENEVPGIKKSLEELL